jgi:hypothetical protein
VIPPIVWIPAGIVLGLALVLWGGMSWAYDRGGRHAREELEAARAARAFRQLPRVPPHTPAERTPAATGYRPRPVPGLGTPIWTPPPAPGQQMWAARGWERHEADALAVANTRPDPHPSGPMRRHEPPELAGPDLTDSQFTTAMAAEVDRFLAEHFPEDTP